MGSRVAGLNFRVECWRFRKKGFELRVSGFAMALQFMVDGFDCMHVLAGKETVLITGVTRTLIP